MVTGTNQLLLNRTREISLHEYLSKFKVIWEKYIFKVCDSEACDSKYACLQHMTCAVLSIFTEITHLTVSLGLMPSPI